jgi:hypothetical protein
MLARSTTSFDGRELFSFRLRRDLCINYIFLQRDIDKANALRNVSILLSYGARLVFELQAKRIRVPFCLA